MRETICTVLGVVGGTLAAAFGGWNAALTTLVFFLSLDYLTGLLVAGVFRRSPKTKTGGLQSKIGWKGLVKKVMVLLLVLRSRSAWTLPCTRIICETLFALALPAMN